MAPAAQPPAPAPGPSSSDAGGVTHLVIRESDTAAADSGDAAPVRTVRIPVKVFSIAARFVPRRVREELEKEGFDLDAMLAAAREIRTPTILAEVEEHEKGRRIVIALE